MIADWNVIAEVTEKGKHGALSMQKCTNQAVKDSVIKIIEVQQEAGIIL